MLGSTLPVRFPECLRAAGECAVTPFAIQPGQVLTPASCGVALRIDGPAGSWVGVWRPAERRVRHLPAPQGWLAGAGLWTRDGVLRLPYATEGVPCGVAEWAVPREAPRADAGGAHPAETAATGARRPRGSGGGRRGSARGRGGRGGVGGASRGTGRAASGAVAAGAPGGSYGRWITKWRRSAWAPGTHPRRPR
ncbi:hypothetical protein GCM10020295_59380 [Streptomyces cinereospinus]